ncbi:unnamed protein product [Diplocarpon coronariae]
MPTPLLYDSSLAFVFTINLRIFSIRGHKGYTNRGYIGQLAQQLQEDPDT